MKKFLILGNMNAITYKDIFPLIKDNKMWTGYKSFSGGMDMITDTGSIRNVSGVIWYTNLNNDKHHKYLELTKTYDPDKYPQYDNYNAINVDHIKDIPVDYYGVIGVPITFINKWCPEQFEIVSEKSPGETLYVDEKKKYARIMNHNSTNPLAGGGYINGTKTFKRIPIRRKDAN